MNTQAVDVERGLGRPVMSRLHALFSLGGFVGSAAGGLAAGRDDGVGSRRIGMHERLRQVIEIVDDPQPFAQAIEQWPFGVRHP